MSISRAACERMDAEDPLAGRRGLFALPEGVIYLDGNSLGPLPRGVPEAVARAVTGAWGQGLIGSWNRTPDGGAGWIDLPERVGARIAPLVGAAADEVIAVDSTSVNLFKLLAAAMALRPERRVILSEPGNFPTDLYVAEGLAGLAPGVELRLAPAEGLAAALTDDVAVLLLSHVHYKSGRVHDMAALTAAAHAAGALVLWDLSHSAGVLDVRLDSCGADLAVGCGYKYLNGGPGAPAFAYAARRWHGELRSPLSGWMGHAEPFAFDDGYRPGAGLARLKCGTPSVLGLTALEAALEVLDDVAPAALQGKARALGDLFLAEVEARLPGVFEVACPRDAAVRGGQVALRHPDGYAIVQALIAAGVVGDFRAPDILRFGFSPLPLSYAEVWDAAARLEQVMRDEVWREARFSARAAVT